ncbi:MAG: N-acyl-D-glucosamine 2-epimerase [Paenibacillaceae bacterium]|jgi:mannobiose 2-epimerase|nr:N-acyl-D-glucosamine 2-epimerase [Paenibacillaceae bacterium]
MNTAALKQEMSGELERILQFWLQETVDEENGGFHGWIDSDMTIRPQAPKGLVLHARILWTFSRAYRHDPKAEYLAMAERALHYLESCFRDQEHPGYFWMVDAQGQPLQTKKQIYGQAFHLYAVSEFIQATGRKELLSLALELFEIVEKSYDPVHGGYLEAYARDWTQETDLRLGEHDQNDKKSMNTHLHILEAYTNLYRIWQEERLEQAFRRLIDITMEQIIDQDSGHFKLFFDEDWTCKSDIISYGHDIEGSWLLVEAAHVLGDSALMEQVSRVALAMAEAVYQEGVDPDGGVMWEGNPQGLTDTDKHWWNQAEAVVGFVNAWQMSGDERYWQMAVRNWNFIKEHIIDREHGEWFWRTDRGGTPLRGDPKVNEWKCPYHNSRACYEIMERL